ncbi:MAG: LysR family transcriptional regulator [Paucibacter sp.]|nr:LysR family transcriptional regulator [Roseateles sp.]
MDRFDAMLAFTRVVELNSFTKASQSLDLPKSTLSAQIHVLEKRLRVKLLHRSTRHISVTPEGAAYYERAVRLLSELEETEAEVSRLATSPHGRLRIDLPATLGRRVIVPNLHDFMRRYPDIQLDVGCTDRQISLLEEGVDCVIRTGTSQDDWLVARHLGVTGMLTCASPRYLEEFGTPQTLADLARHRIVYFISPTTGKLQELKYLQRGKPVTATGLRQITLNDTEACVIATRGGAGLMQAPEYMVRQELTAGTLKQVLQDVPAPVLPFSLLYPPNRHLSVKVRVFADWAAALFASICPAARG